jgi:hypothetical protein
LDDLSGASGVEAAAVYRRAGDIRNWLDDPRSGIELVERALDILRLAPPSIEYVCTLQEYDTLLDALGRCEEARAASALALEICEGMDVPRLHRSLLIQQARHDFDVDLDTADLERALARCDEAAICELDGPDPAGDVFLAMNRTEILRVAGRVGDEVVEAGRPGLEAAAAWGLETFPADCVRANMSSALRLAGQVQRAAELIDPVTVRAQPTYQDVGVHQERACLDMLRGRCAEALARFDATDSLPVPNLGNQVEVAELAAGTYLWCGRPP